MTQSEPDTTPTGFISRPGESNSYSRSTKTRRNGKESSAQGSCSRKTDGLDDAPSPPGTPGTTNGAPGAVSDERPKDRAATPEDRQPRFAPSGRPVGKRRAHRSRREEIEKEVVEDLRGYINVLVKNRQNSARRAILTSRREEKFARLTGEKKEVPVVVLDDDEEEEMDTSEPRARDMPVLISIEDEQEARERELGQLEAEQGKPALMPPEILTELEAGLEEVAISSNTSRRPGSDGYSRSSSASTASGSGPGDSSMPSSPILPDDIDALLRSSSPSPRSL